MNNSWIYSIGTLKVFNRWALLECDDNIGGLYRSLYSLEYFYKPKIQKPLWGSHISIIRGETLLNQTIAEKINNMRVGFVYCPIMKTTGVHFFLPCYSLIFDSVRDLFGLDKTLVNYHLSIGNIVNDVGTTTPETF